VTEIKTFKFFGEMPIIYEIEAGQKPPGKEGRSGV